MAFQEQTVKRQQQTYNGKLFRKLIFFPLRQKSRLYEIPRAASAKPSRMTEMPVIKERRRHKMTPSFDSLEILSW